MVLHISERFARLPQTGVTLKNTFDSSNVVVSELSLDHKSWRGHKFTVVKACNNGQDW